MRFGSRSAPDRVEEFPKTELEKRVFESTLGDGILTSQGASWRWQRRTAAPLFRPADLLSLVPAMSAAGEAQLARWAASPAGTVQAIDHDMTETTFRVISATMFAGSADREADLILRAADKALSTISWDIGFVVGPALGGFVLQAEPLALWPLAGLVCLLAGAGAIAMERGLPRELRLTPA